MGAVFAAFDTKLKRRVALKILHHQASDDALTQILREARAAAALDHPNSVQVFDVGEVDGTPFMSMEYVDGTSLRALIQARSMPSAEAFRVLSDIARALGHAHRAGLVHRDIKPENVMVRADGVVKVLDFGIAKRVAIPAFAGAGGTQSMRVGLDTEGIVGTPLYMAPEQARGEPLDARCDQFAWGLVAHEALSGRLPWSYDAGGMAYLAALISSPAPNLRDIDPSIPIAVADVVARALAKSRDERFENMGAILAALGSPSIPPERLVSSSPTDPYAKTEAIPSAGRSDPNRPATTGNETAGEGLAVTRPRARKRTVFVAAVLAAVVLAAVASFGLLRRSDPATASSGSAKTRAASGVTVLDLPRPITASTKAAAAYLAALRAERDWDYDDAVRSMREALQADPDLAAAAFRLGVFLIVHQPNDARNAFASASRLKDRLSPRDAAVLDAVRPWFSVPSDPGAAGDALGHLEAIYPGDAELLMLRGAGYYVVGRHADAADVLRRSLAADPSFAYASLHLASALAALDKLDEAREVAERCVRRSATALSCWRVRLGLSHEKGNHRECEELSLEAMAANPRAARPVFWNLDASASSGTREKVSQAIDRWLVLQDPAVRDEDAARARALLDVLNGNLGAAARELARLAGTTDQARFRMFRYEPTWLLLLEETGQLDELKEVALRLKERSASELPPTMSGSSILERTEPDVMRALLVSGARDEAGTEAEQRALEQSWLARAPSLAGLVWIRARAALVDSSASAKRALEAAPAGGPPNFLGGSVFHLSVGKTYLLAGQTELARRWLERAVGSCTTLSAPVTWLRSHYWLGRALEASGERERACAAYATVIEHWGRAKPPSVTASNATKAASSLGCR